MTAAVLFKLNNNLKILDLKIPKLKKGQVLVKVFYSGICRSQIEEIYGGRKNKIFLPHLLGHEGSGKVLAIGSGVNKVKIDDDVILTWIKSKGLDSANPEYLYNKKKINSGKVTTFSNYTIVSENRLIKKPKYINFKNAVLLGCSFMTGPGMVLNDLNLKKDTKILIIGLGAIGLGILLALKKKNFKNIILIEKEKGKYLLAKNLGVKYLFNSLSKKTENKIYKIFKEKPDICFESAGSTKTIEFGFKVIKDNGRIHFASHPNSKNYLKIFPHDLISGKKITGTWGGGCCPDRDVKIFARLIKNNESLLSRLLEKEYKLYEINKVINDFKKSLVFRPIIKMQH
jgi:S-(hydroxymethyl)glutathione dehydrogenase/alcohol dehydrogenase